MKADPGTRGAWGHCWKCGQEGHFLQDCPYMDCSCGQVWVASSQARKRAPEILLVPIQVTNIQTTALVNSGCSQMLIKARLIADLELSGREIHLQYVHRDVQPHPTPWVRLETAHWEKILPGLLGLLDQGSAPLAAKKSSISLIASVRVTGWCCCVHSLPAVGRRWMNCSRTKASATWAPDHFSDSSHCHAQARRC